MASYVAGVDIGGTKILAGVADATGQIVSVAHRETPHRSQSPDVVAAVIVEAVDELRTAFDLRAVGVGAAGFVDDSGAVRFAPHLSWRDEPLQRVLSDRLGLPVVVDNDANMTARAEMKLGAGRGYTEALCLTLGTGIGGAIVTRGEVLRGGHGLAGEFGHMQLVPDGRGCECGLTGCWEQYCSGNALLRAALEHVADSSTPGSGLEVMEAALRGAPWAEAAFERVGQWLGVGVAGLVAALDPEVVIIGGGVSAAGALLLEPARRRFRERLPGRGYREEPPIVAAQLGPKAGFIGAAVAARARLNTGSPA